MNQIKEIVLVGHCGFDSGSLRQLAEQTFAEAAVTSVNAAADLSERQHPQALWLVNRVLDGRFSHESGIDLIREVAAGADPPKLMLVSNYADAQEQAVAAGALPGVGKSDLHTQQARQALLAAER